MWGVRSARTVALGAAFAAFLALCALPFAYMLAQAGTAGMTYAALLLDTRQRTLLLNTALLGGGTALVSTLLGAALGFVLARVPLRFTAAWRVALAAPLLLPPYVMALAWVYLGGSGVLSAWTYSLPGAVLVLSLLLYPLSMLATEVALRQLAPRIEEAALTCAPPWYVLRRITLPLVAPAIAAAALVIFVLAVSEFSVPALLRVRVFTSEIFTAFAALYDFRRATVLAMPLVVLAVVVAAGTSLVLGGRLLAPRRGGGHVSTAYEQWTRGAALAGAGVLVMALVVPLAVLMREAVDVASAGAVIRSAGEAIRTSLVLAAVGATLVTAIAVWVGYARGRAGRWAGAALDVLLIALFAVPSTVVGVGLIGVWNRAGVFGGIYGTDGMLLLGYLARFLPVAALGLAAAVRYVPTSHEEAGAVGGAGWWRTMTRIVLPQIRVAVLAVWTIVFILAFGELGASILVAPPGESTLPIRVYTMIANAPPAAVAALALLQAAVVLGPLTLLAWGLAARRPR